MSGTKKQEGKTYSANWGGSRANLKGNAGRKPTGTRRVMFQVSCQPEERERIKILAAQAGKTVSAFIIEKVLQ